MVHPDAEYYWLYRTLGATAEVADDLARESRRKYLNRLERSLMTARYQVLGSDDLLQRLAKLWEHPDASKIVDELIRCDLSDDDRVAVRDILSDLLTTADELPSKQKLIAQRAVYRLLFRLPPEICKDLRQRCLHHPRKLVRKAAHRAMLHNGVHPDEATTLIDQYRKEGDQNLLQLLARWPNAIAEVDDHYVMEEMHDRYWRMRIIQVLLETVPPRAWGHAETHPILFAWAVGRSRHADSIRILWTLLEEHQSDPEFVWWCVWTLGRTGSPSDIARIETIVRQLVDTAKTANAPQR